MGSDSKSCSNHIQTLISQALIAIKTSAPYTSNSCPACNHEMSCGSPLPGCVMASKRRTCSTINCVSDGLGKFGVRFKFWAKLVSNPCSQNTGGYVLKDSLLAAGSCLNGLTHWFVSTQFSTSSAGTLANSPTLLVTMTSPSLRAWAAMCRSFTPMG